MADATFIDYNSPASERSVYFDAPVMHIFSKRKEDEGEGNGDGATSLTTPGRIRSTTSLSDRQGDVTELNMPDITGLPSDREHDESGRDPDSVLSRDYGGGAAKKPRQGSGSIHGAGSDSGYESPTTARTESRQLRDGNDGNYIEPIPVVWAESGTGKLHRRSKSTATNSDDPRRSQSLRSYHTTGTIQDDERESVHTSRSGRYTPADRHRRASLSGGTFASGAGTVGPAAAANAEETSLFRSRSVSAESSLSKKQKLKISKAELKEGKRIAEVIKQEAKAEKKALESSVKELAELQKLQKYAVKEEAKTNASYGQVLRTFHKEELIFLAAQAKFERARADLQAHEDAREAAREHARQATEMLQEKNREVEWLRAQKAADDREREAKIRQLKGKTN